MALTVGVFGTCAAFCGTGSLVSFAFGNLPESPQALAPGEYARLAAEWLVAGLASLGATVWLLRPWWPSGPKPGDADLEEADAAGGKGKPLG